MLRIRSAGRWLQPWLVATVAVLLSVTGCRPDGTTQTAGVPPGPAPCEEDSVAPATAAPAVGLWADQGGEQVRVTARIGPAQATVSASGAVWLPVETLESLPDAPPLRAARDSATVRLDLLPPYQDTGAMPETARVARREPHPAVTYAVSEAVVLASYESCASIDPEPLVRYLRRDEGGQVVSDVMLQRQSVAP